MLNKLYMGDYSTFEEGKKLQKKVCLQVMVSVFKDLTRSYICHLKLRN